MKRNKFLYALIAGICLIAILLLYNFSQAKYIKININNNTNKKMNGLLIKSNALTNDVKVPRILPKSDYKIKLIPSKNFDESNMIMYYLDKQGNNQKIYLLSYFEKGYSGNITVDINSIDSKGILSVKIKQHKNLF